MTNLLVRIRTVAWIATLLTVLNATLDLVQLPHILESPMWTATIVTWGLAVDMIGRRKALEIEAASREAMRKQIMKEVYRLLQAIEKRLNEYERRTVAHVLGSPDARDEQCLRPVHREG